MTDEQSDAIDAAIEECEEAERLAERSAECARDAIQKLQKIESITLSVECFVLPLRSRAAEGETIVEDARSRCVARCAEWEQAECFAALANAAGGFQ